MGKVARAIAIVLQAALMAYAAWPGTCLAQDAAEVRAYMDALAVGTPEAMRVFLLGHPASMLPGSALGARIARFVTEQQPAPAEPRTPPPLPSLARAGNAPAGNGDHDPAGRHGQVRPVGSPLPPPARPPPPQPVATSSP